MSLAHGILLANALSTLALVGLIWTIQLAHYPAFAYVRDDVFIAFEAFHQRAISIVVMPLMLLELGAALALLQWRPDAIPLALAMLGVALVAIVWLSTFFVQVPLHHRLAQGYDGDAIRRLVATNWIRTVAWSLRGGVIAWCLILVMRAEGRP